VESDAEIAEFQDPVGSNQTVARSDVAMDGACGVEQFDGPQQSDNLAAGSWFGPRVGMTLQVVVEIASFHQGSRGVWMFHRKPRRRIYVCGRFQFHFSGDRQSRLRGAMLWARWLSLLRIWWLVLRRR
jgi:hypothetical protein